MPQPLPGASRSKQPTQRALLCAALLDLGYYASGRFVDGTNQFSWRVASLDASSQHVYVGPRGLLRKGSSVSNAKPLPAAAKYKLLLRGQQALERAARYEANRKAMGMVA